MSAVEVGLAFCVDSIHHVKEWIKSFDQHSEPLTAARWPSPVGNESDIYIDNTRARSSQPNPKHKVGNTSQGSPVYPLTSTEGDFSLIPMSEEEEEEEESEREAVDYDLMNQREALRRQCVLQQTDDKEHLKWKATKTDWAMWEGVVYTPAMSNCPSGNPPTEEILHEMISEGYKLSGRVVMTDGVVKNFDTANAMKRMQKIDLVALDEQYMRQKIWEEANCIGPNDELGPCPKRQPPIFPSRKLVVDDTCTTCYEGVPLDIYKDPFKSIQAFGITQTHTCGHYSTSWMVDPEESITITHSQSKAASEKYNVPAGEYKLIKKNVKKTGASGEQILTSVKCCDEPTCCKMSHYAFVMAYGAAKPWDVDMCYNQYEASRKPSSRKFVDTRAMYEKKDLVNGNFDMCYYCLKHTQEYK